MTEVDFNHGIRKVLDISNSLDIGLNYGIRSSLNVSDELKKLCKRTKIYREIYDRISTYKEFNLMLMDESCFQFSESRNNLKEQELRYAFYPNPYEYIEYKKHVEAVRQLLESGDLDNETYQQLLSEFHFNHDIPVIRYDYSPSQYRKNDHPASHFHIGFHSGNRWPISKVLTPMTFFLKVISMYYPHIWQQKFNNFGEETLNDLFSLHKNESFNVDSKYLQMEDYKRLIIS